MRATRCPGIRALVSFREVVLVGFGACGRAGYVGTRARVEARATLQQAEALRRVLEDLGKWMKFETP